MITSRLNLLFLPLLFAVLLTTASKLKIGRVVDNFFYVILSPIQTPVASLKVLTNSKIDFITQIPRIYQENQSLKFSNSNLLSENQSLKDLIKDQAVLQGIKEPYKKTLPVRIISNGNQITVTTTLDMSQVAVGQPVTNGTSLVGVVSAVKKPIITVTPLSDEDFPIIQIKTGLGQTGAYQYSARTTQIINIPSENPVSLNDNVFTQASDKIPANLIIGKVTKILTTAQSPLQKAEIKLNLDPNQLKDLKIILEQ